MGTFGESSSAETVGTGTFGHNTTKIPEITSGTFGHTTEFEDINGEGSRDLSAPSFDSVISEFESSSDPLLQQYAEILKQIRPTLEKKNLTEVNRTLGLISTEEDKLQYIRELKEIEERYKDKADEATGDAKEGEKGVLESLWDGTKGFFGLSAEQVTDLLNGSPLTSEEIKKVTGIDIQGVQSAKDLRDKIESFKSKLPKDVRESIGSQLDKIVEGLDDAQDIGNSEIERYFDEMVLSVREKSGVFYIKNIPNQEFRTKEEAVEYIRDLKSKAEWHFQNGLRTGIEKILGNAVIGLASLENHIWLSGDWSVKNQGLKALSNYFSLDPYDWFIGFAFTLSTFVTASVIAGIHSGAISSAYRRMINDPLSKLNSNRQISDFARNGITIPNDINSPEGQDYMEFKQRQQIMDLLWSDLETKYSPGSPEYKKARRKLQKIDSFKLNRTPTFYYLSYKYAKTQGLHKFIHTLHSFFVRGARFYFPLPQVDENGKVKSYVKFWQYKIRGFTLVEDSKKLANLTIDKLLDTGEIQKGINIFYENKKVERRSQNNEAPKLVVEGNEEKTGKYQNIIDEINSRNVPSKKKAKLIKRFEDYVTKLVDFPKSEKVIARDLFFLLDTDFGKNSNFSDEVKLKIDKIIGDSNIIGKTAARLRLNKLASFRAFKELIDSGEWVGSKEDFDQEIKKLEAQKGYKVSPNYDTKVGNVDFSARLTQTIKDGKDFAEGRKIVLGEFFDTDRMGESFESSREHGTPKFKKLYEFVDFGIHDNNLEKFADQELKDFFNAVLSKKVIIADEKIFYGEIKAITEGYLPSYKLVNELSQLAESKKDHSNITNIKALLEKAKNNDLNFTPDDLHSLRARPESFDYTIDRSRNTPDTIKVDLETQIEKYKDWGNADFNHHLRNKYSLPEKPTSDDYFTALKEKYAGELNSLYIIDTLNEATGNTGRRDSILGELRHFSDALKDNKYSEGQASDMLRRIFTGEAFDTITLVDEKNAASFYDGKAGFAGEVQSIWQGLSETERQSRAEQISLDPDIDTEKLPPQIKTIVKELEGATEAEKLIEKNVGRLQSFIDTIPTINAPSRLQALETQFNTYIDNGENKINVNAPEYKELIEDFRELVDKREKAINPRVSTMRVEPETRTPPVEPEVKPIPVEAPTESPAEQVRKISSILDRAYLEALISGNMSIIEKIEEEFTNINNETTGRLEKVLSQRDIVEFYRSDFGLDQIRSHSSLPTLTAIRQELTKVTGDERFARPPSFGALRSMISSTTDTSIRSAIFDAFSSGKLTR